MPKIKTHKATVKRFKRTGSDNLTQRKQGQDHFNARESGNATRQKRKDISVNSCFVKTVKTLTPYN